MSKQLRNSWAKELSRLLEMDVADIASLPALYRHATHLLRFSYRVIERFIADKCIQRASALAYASLLAIVPMVVLGFSIFTSFQAFDAVSGHVRDLLLEYLIPASQKAVEDYLSTITDQSAAISIFGVIGLLFTATALLNTVEEAFNSIWRITRARGWLSKFITFWSTLTLAPILIGASLTITSYFAAMPLLRHVAEGAGYLGQLPFLLPWLMSSLALATLYTVLPNTTVPFRYALVGGLAGGALFEWTKIGFAFYITEIANYEKLYGALSTLPIFLVWLYLAWVVVLLGSEITFCLQHPEQSNRHRNRFIHPGLRQFYSHLILLRAAQALEHGQTLSMDRLLAETDVPENILQEWLDRLTELELLRRTDIQGKQAWVLARDSDRIELMTIFQNLNDIPMQIPEEWKDTTLGRQLAGLYFRMQREHADILTPISLKQLLARTEEEEDAGFSG
ncbi:YihY family inner membrane protein [Mariprofundus erugo]|nr:YihY family inner membrane protein [Mariprofundus erugo]